MDSCRNINVSLTDDCSSDMTGIFLISLMILWPLSSVQSGVLKAFLKYGHRYSSNYLYMTVQMAAFHQSSQTKIALYEHVWFSYEMMKSHQHDDGLNAVEYHIELRSSLVPDRSMLPWILADQIFSHD